MSQRRGGGLSRRNFVTVVFCGAPRYTPAVTGNGAKAAALGQISGFTTSQTLHRGLE
jgi:hypothetical protein